MYPFFRQTVCACHFDNLFFRVVVVPQKCVFFFWSEGLKMFKLEFVVTAGFFLINDVRDR